METEYILYVLYGFASGLLTGLLAFPPAWLHQAVDCVFGGADGRAGEKHAGKPVSSEGAPAAGPLWEQQDTCYNL